MDLPGCWACLARAWARRPLPSDPAMFVEPGLLSSNWVYFSIPGCKWSQLSVADLWEEHQETQEALSVQDDSHGNSGFGAQ